MSDEQPDDGVRPEADQTAVHDCVGAAHQHAAAPAEDDPCAAAIDRLWAYLDHELEAPDAQELREHLADCTPCLEEYGIDVVMKTVVRRGCQESAPETLRLRIHQTLLHVSTDPQA